MTTRIAKVSAALLVAGLACAPVAFAQAAHSAAAQKQDDGTKGPGTGQGQVASVDPVTGQLRPPTQEELAALAATMRMLSRDDSKLQPVYHPDGAISIDLQGTYLSVATATVGTDGKVVFACTTSAKGEPHAHPHVVPARPQAKPVLEEK